jgi:hypothetical protein
MDDLKRNLLVVQIAKKLENDNVSLDEQDAKILEVYYKFALNELNIENLYIEEIVNEAFLYLKMQNTTDIDPIKEGDKFAAGFS